MYLRFVPQIVFLITFSLSCACRDVLMTKLRTLGRRLAIVFSVVVLAGSSVGQQELSDKKLEMSQIRSMRPRFERANRQPGSPQTSSPQIRWAKPGLAQAGFPRADVGHAILAQPTLQLITRQAGYIFVGKVIGVKHMAASNPDEVATMRVTFRVEQALRGVRAGTDLTVAEWAGLWNGGERYRVGGRMLLFLYPKSRLGLTSPVAGRQGRFDVDHTGVIEIDAERRLLLGNQQIARAPGRKIRMKELTRAIRRAARQEER